MPQVCAFRRAIPPQTPDAQASRQGDSCSVRSAGTRLGHDKDGIAPYTKPASRLRTKPVLDIKWIRDNQDAFLKGLTDRGFDDPSATLNRILSLDEQRRGTIQKLQEAQARRNAASKEIGQAMAAKDEATRRSPEGGGAAPQDRDPRRRGQRARGREELRRTCSRPFPTAGCRRAGRARRRAPMSSCAKSARRRNSPFQPKQHFELGEALGLMDFETAAKLSGARFVVLKGRAGAARTRARPVHARPAHERARLHRDQPAAARARRRHVRHCATAEVCGRSILAHRGAESTLEAATTGSGLRSNEKLREDARRVRSQTSSSTS